MRHNKNEHPGKSGVFLLFWEVQRGIRLCGDCAGEKGFWHTDLTHRGRQGTAPRRGTPGEPGVFLLFREVRRGIRLRGDCAGEKGFWHTDLAYRERQGVAPRRGSTARVCRLSKIRAAVRHTETFRFSLFTLH